ncbi:Protein of unknown function [Gryllus bimaculatus]|nr:Protein of unknown function [Gryllus bimaculatus]
MGFDTQAGALFLTAVLLHTVSMGQGKVVRSRDLDVIKPGNRPCPEFCPEIYQPVCVVGRHTPPRTIPNRCFAAIYACDEREVLWVIRDGPCPCKSHVRLIHH